ncbi:MAG: hypothetical protein ACK4NC_03350 [Candidatus Gracilibacteria bacterium]
MADNKRSEIFLDKIFELMSERNRTIIISISLLAGLTGLASLNNALLPIPAEKLRLILIAILNLLPIVLWHYLVMLSAGLNIFLKAILGNEKLPKREKHILEGREAYFYNFGIFTIVWVLSYYLVLGQICSLLIVILCDILIIVFLYILYHSRKSNK